MFDHDKFDKHFDRVTKTIWIVCFFYILFGFVTLSGIAFIVYTMLIRLDIM